LAGTSLPLTPCTPSCSQFIEDKSRRHITFSKRKAGIMKKAYELSALTGTQVLLLVASETGHVYTYATEKLQPLIQKPEGKNLIQTCLSAPDNPPEQPPPGRTALPGGYDAAAMAAAAAVAASQDGRPAKQRKVGPGDGLPGGMFPGMPGGGVPGYGMGMPGGGFPGMPQQNLALLQGLGLGGGGGMGGLGQLGQLGQLQGLSPALLQGLMQGGMPLPGMPGMDSLGGGGQHQGQGPGK